MDNEPQYRSSEPAEQVAGLALDGEPQYRESETHDEFLERACRVFPVEASLSWSRFERSVFNHLLGKLVHRHGYAGISDAMLVRAHREMQDIVSRTCRPVMH